MKPKAGRYPILNSQEINFNKTIQSWKYSDKHSLSSEELCECLKSLKKDDIIPFVILDIREPHELEIFELPKSTQVQL